MSDKIIDFPKIEKDILEFWTKNKIFELCNKISQGHKEYVFFDGPPFATGLPHYGHILSGTIKDTIGRFYYQKGFNVERRFGWDCHGLPVEYEIDKKFNITNRSQILEMGIDVYNHECRKIVQKYTSEWEETVIRMGRWVDFKGSYKTMDLEFMESIWFIFKELFKRNKIYRGFKIMPFSTACKTALSNFEASQNYKDVSDPSILISFKIINYKDILNNCENGDIEMFFVAWTTTPWTLPANCALAINPDYEYAIFYINNNLNKLYIMLKNRIGVYFKQFCITTVVLGKKLIGISYVPLFNYYKDYITRGFFKTISGNFVTASDGSGIVHTAPAFGEEDYNVFLTLKLLKPDEIPPCHIDENGKFTIPMEKYANLPINSDISLNGMYFKDADKIILQILKPYLIYNSRIVHSYPFCWRSDTPLLYKLIPNWFVKITDIREKLLIQNKKINWIPETIKYKRFQNWLSNAKDWAISRNRFWGTPLPIWALYENGIYNYNDLICVGSIKELEDLTNTKITDLHREHIDQLLIKYNGKIYKRIEDVLDCWFESGSMPYAQNHLKGIKINNDITDKLENINLNNTYLVKENFPADFIGEGLDQTRGWFYTLHVISTILFNSPAFKNVIVNGIVLAEDGKKMSKRLKNYPDPMNIFNKYGADALRMYLISSPVVEAENLRFNENGVKEILKTLLIPWYNTLVFYKECQIQNCNHTLLLDTWIESELNILINKVNIDMSEYKLNNILNYALDFIENLNNWYIRINRKELKNNGSYLKTIIKRFSIVMSAFVPFFSDYSYQTVCSDKISVHLEMIPEYKNINSDFNFIKYIIDGIRHLREKYKLKLKKSLKEVIIVLDDVNINKNLFEKYESVIKSECNVLNIILNNISNYSISTIIKPNFKELNKNKNVIKEKLNTISKLTTNDIENIKNGIHDININEILIETYINDIEYSGVFNNIGIILNIEETKIIKELNLARDFYSFINKLRKKLKLKTSDNVNISLSNDNSNGEFIIELKRVMNIHYTHDITFTSIISDVLGSEKYIYDNNKVIVSLSKY